MKALLLRADAGSKIGTGHVFRCIALGQAWREEGGDVVLAGSGYPDSLRRRAESAGLQVVPFAHVHPDPVDTQMTEEIAARHAAEWIVVDGYHFDLDYQRAIRKHRKLLLVDDTAQQPAYEADLLLNQNLGAERLTYPLVAASRTLRGSRFALLRSEFLAWRDRPRSEAQGRLRLLVTLGGSDPENITLIVVQGLIRLACDVRVLIGPANPRAAEMRATLASMRPDVMVMTDVSDMPAMLHWADLAITAGGSTCWELAFMGVPMAVIVVAENQRRIAEALAEAGAAVNLGWHAGLQPNRIEGSIGELLAYVSRREHMAARVRTIIDGEGRDRVIQAMIDRPLRLRTARPEDCRQIWEWANDPGVRAVSFESAAIPWDLHRSWFGQKLQDPAVRMYVAVDLADVPIGQVRFERDSADATISVSLDGRMRGRGLGSVLLSEATQRYFREHPAINCVHAYIKPGNEASIRAFQHAGYSLSGETHVGQEAALDFVRRGAQ